MRIGENHQLVRRCGSALLGLEVLADGFAQHGMTEVFLPVEDIADGGGVPAVRVCNFLVTAILRLIHGSVGRRYQHLFLCQNFRNACCGNAPTCQPKNFPDNLCGRLVHDKGLFIARFSLVAIGNGAAAPQPFLHSGLEYRLDFVAGVLCVPLVYDVQKRSEVIVLRGGAVHIVVDSYETNALLREKNLCVVANLQIVSAKTTEILYHKGLHSSGFDFFQQGGKTGTIKVRTGIAVIIEVPNISQPMLTGIFFKIFLLILDGVRFSSLFIIS